MLKWNESEGLEISNIEQLNNWLNGCCNIRHYCKLDNKNTFIQKVIKKFKLIHTSQYIKNRLTYFYRTNCDNINDFNEEIKIRLKRSVNNLDDFLK